MATLISGDSSTTTRNTRSWAGAGALAGWTWGSDAGSGLMRSPLPLAERQVGQPARQQRNQHGCYTVAETLRDQPGVGVFVQIRPEPDLADDQRHVLGVDDPAVAHQVDVDQEGPGRNVGGQVQVGAEQGLADEG